MSKEEDAKLSAQLSIILEYLNDLNERMFRLEKKELSNTIVDTNNYSSKIPQTREKSLLEVGEKVEEERETLQNSEDIIKEKIRKVVDQILEYSKNIDYIQSGIRRS